MARVKDCVCFKSRICLLASLSSASLMISLHFLPVRPPWLHGIAYMMQRPGSASYESMGCKHQDGLFTLHAPAALLQDLHLKV